MKTQTRVALAAGLVVAGVFLSLTLNTAGKTGAFATGTVEPRPAASVPISELSPSERAVMDTLIEQDRVSTTTIGFQVSRTDVLTVSRIGSTVFFGPRESGLPDTMYVRADGETYQTVFVGSGFSTRLPNALVSGICFLAAAVLWQRGDTETDESVAE